MKEIGLSTHMPLNWKQAVTSFIVDIGSGNGLSPVQCPAITWTNDDLLSIGP